MFFSAMEMPAAMIWPPNFSRTGAHRVRTAWISTGATLLQEPVAGETPVEMRTTGLQYFRAVLEAAIPNTPGFHWEAESTMALLSRSCGVLSSRVSISSIMPFSVCCRLRFSWSRSTAVCSALWYSRLVSMDTQIRAWAMRPAALIRGSQPIGDVIGIKGGAVHPADLGQGFDARTSSLLNDMDAGAGENPVFLFQGDHVGHGADGHKVAVMLQVRFRQGFPGLLFSHVLPQGNDKIKGHPHTGQIVQARCTVRSFGIDNGHGRRKGPGNFVVIGNDDIDVLFSGRCHGIVVVRTTVHGDDQIHVLLNGHGHMGRFQTVSLPGPVGDIPGDLGIDMGEKIVENSCGGDAVGIEIPEN